MAIKFNPTFAKASIRESKKSKFHFRVGCCIGSKNKILSLGYNQIKTHPLSLDDYHMIHAEFDAAHKLQRPCSDSAYAYVYRIKADGTSGCARPCDDCIRYLKGKGIKNVWFSINNCWEYLYLGDDYERKDDSI